MRSTTGSVFCGEVMLPLCGELLDVACVSGANDNCSTLLLLLLLLLTPNPHSAEGSASPRCDGEEREREREGEKLNVSSDAVWRTSDVHVLQATF